MSLRKECAMKTATHGFASIVISISLTLLSTVYAGSLQPPSAPAATMKTLDQVEPRIPINADSTPGDSSNGYIISESGSYYLAGNLTTDDKNGIKVTADDVTIDLNGFTLKGSDTKTGIYVYDLRKNTIIRNGIIRDFSLGISQNLTTSSNCSVIGVTVTSNAERGINLIGASSIIKDCVISENGTDAEAIYIRGILTGDNSIVTGNTVHDNGGNAIFGLGMSGITVGKNCIVSNNTAAGGGGGAVHSTLTNCIVTANHAADDGGGADECTLTSCAVSNNVAGDYGYVTC